MPPSSIYNPAIKLTLPPKERMAPLCLSALDLLFPWWLILPELSSYRCPCVSLPQTTPQLMKHFFPTTYYSTVLKRNSGKYISFTAIQLRWWLGLDIVDCYSWNLPAQPALICLCIPLWRWSAKRFPSSLPHPASISTIEMIFPRSALPLLLDTSWIVLE